CIFHDLLFHSIPLFLYFVHLYCNLLQLVLLLKLYNILLLFCSLSSSPLVVSLILIRCFCIMLLSIFIISSALICSIVVVSILYSYSFIFILNIIFLWNIVNNYIPPIWLYSF